MEMQYVYQVICLVLLILVVIFAFYLPDRRKKQSLNANIEKIHKGNMVVTKNGLKGRVTDVNEDSIILTVQPRGTNLEVAKWAILDVK
ncbi:MAG: preprotein translocase subunit YajC [Hespellia sp.]|nr:preprotein translocase subunit YajC [Hespellia sp.]